MQSIKQSELKTDFENRKVIEKADQFIKQAS